MNNIFADIQLAIPEIFVISMACVILLVDRFTHERMPSASFLLTQVTLLVGFYLTLVTAPAGATIKAFWGSGSQTTTAASTTINAPSQAIRERRTSCEKST